MLLPGDQGMLNTCQEHWPVHMVHDYLHPPSSWSYWILARYILIFSPLGQSPIGLMLSLCVRRASCTEISQKLLSKFFLKFCIYIPGPPPPGPPKSPPEAIFAPFGKFLKNCSLTFSIILNEHAPGHNKYSWEICIWLNHSKGFSGPP